MSIYLIAPSLPPPDFFPRVRFTSSGIMFSSWTWRCSTGAVILVEMDISDGESFGFVNTASALGVGEGVRLCGLLVVMVLVLVFSLCICVCSDVGISPFFLLSSVLFSSDAEGAARGLAGSS